MENRNSQPGVISRAEARECGRKTYFTGLPCRNGHVAERWTNGGGCRECIVAAAKSERGRANRRAYERTDAFQAKLKQPKVKERRQRYEEKRRTDPKRKEYSRDLRFKQKYGLERGEFELMLQLQGNACLICSRQFENIGANLKRKGAPVVDHCHANGAVRGLLCGTCNSGIGMFDEDPTLLARAAEYVTRVKAFS